MLVYVVMKILNEFWIMFKFYLKLKWQEDKGIQYSAIFIICSLDQFILTNKKFHHFVE